MDGGSKQTCAFKRGCEDNPRGRLASESKGNWASVVMRSGEHSGNHMSNSTKGKLHRNGLAFVHKLFLPSFFHA